MALPRLPRAALYAIALAALALAALAVLAWQGTAVDVVPARSAPLTQTVVVSGRVLAPARVDIGATITGRVQTVGVDEGDRVKAGQVLVELERAELAAALAQAVAAEQAAVTRIAQWRDVGVGFGARAAGAGRGELPEHRARRRAAGAALQAGLHRRVAPGRSAPRADRREEPIRDRARRLRRQRAGRGRSPPPRRPAGAGASGEGNGGRQARADHAARAGGGRRPRSQRRARRHRAARQAAARARARRRRPAHRADRREESRRAARGPARARVGGRLSEPAVRRRAVLPVARDRRAARHRGGQVRRSRAAAVPAFRHDGVDRHRGRGQGRRARHPGRRGARAAVAPALGARRARRPRRAPAGADRRPHGRAGRSARRGLPPAPQIVTTPDIAPGARVRAR